MSIAHCSSRLICLPHIFWELVGDNGPAAEATAYSSFSLTAGLSLATASALNSTYNSFCSLRCHCESIADNRGVTYPNSYFVSPWHICWILRFLLHGSSPGESIYLRSNVAVFGFLSPEHSLPTTEFYHNP